MLVRPEELFRLDSEFYRQSVLDTWSKIQEGRHSRLENICSWITQGPNPVFSESGYPCLTGRNIATGFVKADNSDYVDATEFENLSRFNVLKGDILITLKGLGSTGKVGFVGKGIDAIFSRNLGIIRSKTSDIPAEYLMVFLSSRHGQGVIDRGVTGGTGQRTLPTTYLKGLNIPRFNYLESRIAEMLKRALDAEKASADFVKKAQNFLLVALDYTQEPTSENVSAKSFSESYAASGRLDAEFYQPKFDELFRRIHENAEYVKTIGEIASYIERGCVAQYDEQGTCSMITQKHLTESDIDYENLDKTTQECWERNESAQVRQNDILVYSTGANVGRTQVYLSDKSALACQDIVTIRPDREDPIYVACVLNSAIGRLQTEKFKSGCAQPHLYPKDISQFVVPFVSLDKQNEIVSRLLEAREKKAESHCLLEKAKQAVEIAIEKGEEAAMAYLEGRAFVAQTITQDLAQKAPYFSIDAARRWLAEQKMSYAPDTVKTYLSRQKKAGKIFDAGRGWYSSISTPYQLDTAPVEQLVGELKKAFPLLDFACWSTEQLNEMLHHQLAKHVQFIYVERDAIDSIADWLKSHGYHTYANPGKSEIKRTFSVEENTAVVLPLTTKTPHRNGFATIEKILVDVLADTETFSVINIPEFVGGASGVIKSQRVDISELKKYSNRRKTDISSLINGLVIH